MAEKGSTGETPAEGTNFEKKNGKISETFHKEVSQFYSPHYIWRVILLRSYIMLRIVVFGYAEFGE